MSIVQQLTVFARDNPLLLLAALPIMLVAAKVVNYLTDPSGLRSYPGPFLAKFTDAWIFWKVSRNRWSSSIEDVHKKYGPIVRIAPNHVSIADTKALAIVYGHSTGFTKSNWYDIFANFAVANIFNTRSRSEHARKRRMEAHMFAPQSIRAVEPISHAHVTELLRQWDNLIAQVTEAQKGGRDRGQLGTTTWSVQDGRVWTDCMTWLNFWAFDTIGDLAFGLPFGMLKSGRDTAKVAKSPEEGFKAIDTISKGGDALSIEEEEIPYIEYLSARAETNACLAWLPPTWKRILQKLPVFSAHSLTGRKLAALSIMAVARRLANPNPRQDMLQKLLEARDDEGKALSPQELSAEAFVLIVAGSDTIANTTCVHTIHNSITTMGLFFLDYGAGNVQSLANSLKKLGHEFEWITSPDDFHKASSLIFPGVGAFGQAIDALESKGLLEPLREYIASGKPYFGICIGMQVLFQSSTENSSKKGLGIIPSPIDEFSRTDKAVPHIGWNAVDLLDSEDKSDEGLSRSARYYFVHSYRATYDPSTNPEAAEWAHGVTQYGQEIFIASVRKANVFGTQFHPEKSGEAGLKIIDAWLSESEASRSTAPATPRITLTPRPKDGLTKRIIACMDVRSNDNGDLVVTKGDQYDVREKAPSAPGVQTSSSGAVRNLGKPVALAAKYYVAGADELCLMNITSFRHSPLLDQPMLAVVRAAAEEVFVPLTIGGGIKDTVDPDGTKRSALEVAGAYFRAGADKVSIASEAVKTVEQMRALASARGEDPDLASGDGTSGIETIAKAYGRQAVVVSIDPRRVYVDPAYDGPHKSELVIGKEGTEESGKAWWYQCTISGGRENRPLSVVQLARGVEKLGAGEIVLNSIDRDGTGKGFDIDLIQLVRKAVSIPIVASSGAGSAAHFVEVFEKTGVEAALAAGIFHRGEVGIEEVKKSLAQAGQNARI